MPSALFSPLALRGATLANRIVVSPMCQYSAEDGSANDWHLIHLGSLALSGAGMLITEATHVEPIGRITPGCLGLYSDDNERALGRVMESIRRHSDIVLGIQVAHAGRKGSSAAPWAGGQLLDAAHGGWQPVGPSAIPHSPNEAPPAALDAAGLVRVRNAFVDTTRRAARLGFDTMELHFAHGYLLHEFLSPLANQRTDSYGGSTANRMRYPLEVFRAVRDAWPGDRALGVRVSASDWVEGGWDLPQTLALVAELKALGCDWIDCSSGGVSPQQKIPLGPGYQAHFAKAVREASGLPTMAVGLITDPKHAEEIVASGTADMVALARGMLYDPRWPWHAAAVLGAQVDAPKQYWRSQPREAGAIFRGASTGMR